jgi:hypothetical protein
VGVMVDTKSVPKGDETSTIDPAGKIDPLTGAKQFLAWNKVIENGEEIQKAVGADGTVYKIVEDKPPVVKNYKLIIAEETETPINTDPHPIDIQNVDSGNIEEQEEVIVNE